ncbi:MAG: carboxymuconolactone decarboxylase family protein [Tepidiformaceae bacterium]
MSQRIELGAILMRDGKLWMVRPGPASPWALPGGPLTPDHEDTDAAMDEMLAAFGVSAPAIDEDFLETRYLPFPGGQVVYNIYAATEWSGEPAAGPAGEGAWLALDDLKDTPVEPWLRDALLELFGYQQAPGRDREMPAALGATQDLAETAEAGADAHARALDVLGTLGATEPRLAEERLQARYPELAGDIVRAIGDAWTGPALDRRTRSLQVVAMLAALGGRAGPLRTHINGALNHGAQPAQVIETLRMVAVYAGFPAALEAWPLMEEVFAARGITRPGSAP